MNLFYPTIEESLLSYYRGTSFILFQRNLFYPTSEEPLYPNSEESLISKHRRNRGEQIHVILNLTAWPLLQVKQVKN